MNQRTTAHTDTDNHFTRDSIRLGFDNLRIIFHNSPWERMSSVLSRIIGEAILMSTYNILSTKMYVEGLTFCDSNENPLPLYMFLWRNMENDPLNIIWARSCENRSHAICEQQRSRSAYASTQSDQHLCCSLLRPKKKESVRVTWPFLDLFGEF